MKGTPRKDVAKVVVRGKPTVDGAADADADNECLRTRALDDGDTSDDHDDDDDDDDDDDGCDDDYEASK